jgi:hypothetical protein
MLDPITLLATVCLQLGIDVVRQVAFALPIAFAWEFERNTLWQEAEHSMLEVALLITGLAAGSISVLTWPQENFVSYPLAALVAVASPLVTGLFMFRTGRFFRELGKVPPSMFAIRDATIFALGISLTRVAML